MTDPPAILAFVSLIGTAGGLVLLMRGLRAYRAGGRVRGIGSSPIVSVAAGEVRVVGSIEPGLLALVSPLQSEPCVYYRSRITEERGDTSTTVFSDEGAVGFLLRDTTGTIRVFPRGGHWDAPLQFDERSDWTGDDPPGLRRNRGPATQVAVEDREAAIARLLTVQVPERGPDGDEASGGTLGLLGGGLDLGVGRGRRRYEEWRLMPGDTVTIVGAALPFRDVDDPATADRYDPLVGLDDPEVARSVAEARAAGILRETPEEAWGNAAIPGFGIGRPTRQPELDPDATPPSLAPAVEAEQAAARFDIAPGELVLVSSPDVPLTVRAGTPGQAIERDQQSLLVGLLGAVVAIVGVMALALVVEGVLR